MSSSSRERHVILPTNLYFFLRRLIADFDQIMPYLPSSGTVIDVGCGYGQLAHYLAVHYPQLNIIGFDPDAGRIDSAKQLFTLSNLTFMTGTAEETRGLPSSDAIIFFDVLHHIAQEHQVSVLKQYIQTLKSGGRIVIKDIDLRPRWKFWFNYLHDRLMTKGEAVHYRSAQEWGEVLAHAGLAVTIVTHNTWRPYPHVVIIGEKHE